MAKFKNNNLYKNTRTVVPQCKVVIYPWVNESLFNRDYSVDNLSDNELSDTTPLDISSQITSFNYTKNNANAAGAFSFTLSSSPGIGSEDWKDIIKRGTWCLIYLTQDGDLTMTSKVAPPIGDRKKEAPKLRCMGFIDRVAISAAVNENGAFVCNYEVSGRDFGVVYEDTTIWHNSFAFDETLLQGLHQSKLNVTGTAKIDEALDIIHKLFYDPSALPGAKTNANNSLTSIALQWLLPRKLVNDIGFSNLKVPYWGKLNTLSTSKTEAGLPLNSPVDFLTGNAWQQLKRIANTEFHELFTELSDSGQPKLIFRPIPFALNKRKYPIVGQHITLYKDLNPAVSISAIDILDFNMGEDNYSRYNSFLTTISTQLINQSDGYSFLQGTRFPLNMQPSIKRYGFRPMHTQVDTILKNAERADGAGNAQILREYNEVLLDYWANAIYAESGSITIVGRNDIKIGKASDFTEEVPYINDKRFYIEGYMDQFIVNENGTGTWVQTLDLTRGFEKSDLVKGTFENRATDFTQAGEFTPARKGKDK